MSLRFLKKKDGTKVLQEYNPATTEWKDVEMVDESIRSRLVNEINKDKYRGCLLNILISKDTSYEISDYYSILGHTSRLLPSSFMGYKMYVCEDLKVPFKILKEI